MRQVLTLATFYSVFMAAPAYAYLDPITGSFVVQAIIGGLASAMIAIRRVREKILSLIGIGKRNHETVSSEDKSTKL